MALRRRRGRDERAVLAGAASAAAAEVDSSVPAELDPTAGAFFDVDNTMMMGASIFHFARGLASRGFFTTRDLLDFAWQQVKFRAGGLLPDQEPRSPSVVDALVPMLPFQL